MSTATPLRDHAYNSFMEKLLSRDIVPGQIVSQRELVALTGLPLGAIREMIPRLEADGFIRTAPKRGLQVVSISLDLVRDAYQLRTIIEAEALRLFCDTADNAQIDALLTAHQDILEQAKSGVDSALLQHAQATDWGFHDLIVTQMHNEIISKIHQVNAIKVRLMSNDRITAERLTIVMNEHIPILEALKRRDKDAACKALCDHIDAGKLRALHR